MDPGFALAGVSLSDVLMFENRWDTAREVLSRVQRADRALTKADRLRMRAMLARASANPFDEQQSLQELIGLQPRCKDCRYQLGESYFHVAEADKAAAEYSRLIQLDAGYALAYNHLGYCYLWKGEHARAIETLKRYVDLDKTPNALDSLADAYMLQGDYARAAELKREAYRRDPSFYFAPRSLAYIDMLRGRYRDAEALVSDTLAKAPSDDQKARSLAALAYLSYKTGRLERAADAAARGLALQGPKSTESPTEELLWLQGLIDVARGHVARAQVPLARLEQMVTGRTPAVTGNNFRPVYKHYLHLDAVVRAARGETMEARHQLEEIAWLRNKLGYWGTPYDAAFFLDEIGRVAERIGAQNDAEKWYRDALAYNGHYAPARLHLASLLQKTRRPDQAKSELATFSEEWKLADADGPEAQTARELEKTLSR
jgi:tetratricopeptide (TPR) repeat protein